jgi:hypothetical protein
MRRGNSRPFLKVIIIGEITLVKNFEDRFATPATEIFFLKNDVIFLARFPAVKTAAHVN